MGPIALRKKNIKIIELREYEVPYFRAYPKELGKVEEKSGMIGKDSHLQAEVTIDDYEALTGS